MTRSKHEHEQRATYLEIAVDLNRGIHKAYTVTRIVTRDGSS
jgi:hypothetical protein